jgi:CheY-like chemotaxis protein
MNCVQLRTPITAIVASSAVLARADVDEARRCELAKRIGDSARALLILVEDLLDLARTESGRLPLQVQPFSLLEAASEVAQTFEHAVEARGIALGVEGASTAFALSDPSRTRQILVNLVGNAIKFTDRGGITLRVSEPARGLVAVEVRDTGRGIPEHARAALFAPFHEGEPTVRSDSGGLGIGLALSHRLAQALGGELTLVESSVARGTAFRLTLPAAPEGVPVDVPRAQSSPKRTLEGVSALLVDDNEDVREAIADLLSLSGARVSQLSDGAEALTQLLDGSVARPFDVILMDVRMPDPDGLEVTRRLRAAGLRTPIIALTADAAPEHRAECIDAGCDDYLNKPIDLPDLVGAISRALTPPPP